MRKDSKEGDEDTGPPAAVDLLLEAELLIARLGAAIFHELWPWCGSDLRVVLQVVACMAIVVCVVDHPQP